MTSSIRHAGWGALAFLLALACPRPAAAQAIGNYVPPKQALRLELATPRRIVAPGGAIPLTVRFVNQGSEPIPFTEPADYLAGLEITRITDGPPEVMKKGGPPSAPAGVQTLAPGAAYEKTLDLTPLLPQEEAAYQFGWRFDFADEVAGAKVGLWGEPDPKYKLRQFLRKGAARMTTCAVWSDARLARLRNTLAILETPQGKITLEFFPEDAPITVSAFVNRVRAGGYDGGEFHRIIKGFMMQGGDPRKDGTGDAGYKLAQEFSDRPHAPGIVSMARSAGPDSASCQFFICFGTPSYLDRAYTAFARVVEGMDTVKAVETVRTFGPPGDAPIEPVTLIKAVLAERPAIKQE